MNKNFKVKRLGVQDLPAFRELLSIFKEVFEEGDSPGAGPDALHTLLERMDFVALGVFYKEEVIGGLTAFELPLYTSSGSELFIYDVGISITFQRKGLGSQLIRAAQDYCRENSIGFMFVQANQEDTHALDFYRSCGGMAEQVVNFGFSMPE
jgi:aminoglycoside 3-N-acetyltransferase I